ncbi:uncharacterized protein LOC126905827 isoform X1 [Daktulosphaira vitifoliae]|uniref:uncharacterized protein LOC126905827 isoform X1 n=1 Tax=Daktulosphaira vitifoliae TaxID=58002 RepID=UPI0021AAC36D|nr:uncharacterized protein LOC126905827 isoform X1 [Daktulosphaira vitifoliae]
MSDSTRVPITNIYQGGGHFEFSSEKNWGVVDNDCKLFDSLDLTHIADSLASIPFHLRHNLPKSLFSVEQLEEFEVESSLAFSRHTFQCNSKAQVDLTWNNKKTSSFSSNKLLEIILSGVSNEEKTESIHDETGINSQLNDILGNNKNLQNTLKDIILNTTPSQPNVETSEKSETSTMKIGKLSVDTNQTNAGHWLDSMLDSDDD